MNYQIFPGLKTKQDAKVRVSEMHRGDEFTMFNVQYIILSVDENRLNYTLKGHTNDAKAAYHFGRRSQKLVMKKGQR